MRWIATVFAAALTLTCAAPAAADDGYVDLTLFASLNQSAYLQSDEVRLNIRLVNTGTAPATGVVVRSQGDLEFTKWGELDASGPGIELPAGEDVEIAVTASPNDPGNGMAQLLEAVSAEPDRNPADNRATVDAFVTEKWADLAVTVHRDADRDGVVDAGETKEGEHVTIRGGLASEAVSVRTDAAGVASFPGITGGLYSVELNLPKNWYVGLRQEVKVRGGTNTATIRAVPNDFSALSASISFDRASYAPGDTVRERVTLTNSGISDIVGVVAHCGGVSIEGVDNLLYSTGWGELNPGAEGPGVVVRAGETRTWEFTDVVPPGAWRYGYMVLQCDFSPWGMLDGANVEIRAAVPGGLGTASGTLFHEGEPVAGVGLLLYDTVNGKIVARTESDDVGRFQVPELPAGIYDLRPLGPWRVHERTFYVQIFAGDHRDFTPIRLDQGPTNLDPEKRTDVSIVDPPAAPAPAPRPQPRASPRPATLAATGADVVELFALGALLVVAGGLLMRARRPSRP
jgi:hypothetical protein